MRWDAQALQPALVDDVTAPTAAPLLPMAGLLRSISTPEFAGITFHEVTAKSVLNKVPPQSTMPFGWTVNPYRGCSHACVYCFARKSHTYLDFDSGLDFDSQVVVKVNAGPVLRAELARPSWTREHVALGTNTDPYQRAEGRYRLMPGIIEALAESGTPFSILTKGTLLSRDIPLLKEAAQLVPIGLGISLAMMDEELQAAIEPGTPGPRARLRLVSRLREAGLPCGVMAMPILPYLSDSDDALDELFSSLAAAGATGVTAGALYLRPGTREWFMSWLARNHPSLVGKYRRLYGGPQGSGSYADAGYRKWLAQRVAFFKRKHGFPPSGAFAHDGLTQDSATEFHPDPRVEEAQYPQGSMPERPHPNVAAPRSLAAESGHRLSGAPRRLHDGGHDREVRRNPRQGVQGALF
ncbi:MULTISPECIES: Rv2578c family radical SAM protein [Arthrobacter]|uniref:Rv2578c family radical SAM protein n=2 Tax=Arthrobacter TaxID=1663 RepID=A0ABU9KM50_9MICC|nr:Rv2578c family radical SAM protein [Arthrobacter sp. YJM1]MDP5227881.1 Rv2578c family radical SAM protein [Arthrobacter sp. YJM1]